MLPGEICFAVNRSTRGLSVRHSERCEGLATAPHKNLPYLFYFQNMKDKQTSMGGFAAYARNMNSYKSNIHNYHRTVDYIKSLFEVGITNLWS